MLAIQIDRADIEETLSSQFKTPEKIKEYIYSLVIDEMEDRNRAKMLEQDHKKDFVSKEDVFKALDSI